MNYETAIETEPDERARLLSAQELNAYLDALTESFNNLSLGFVRRSRMFAVPSGWKPEGLTITCSIRGPAYGFLALSIDSRLSARIARYMAPKRIVITEKDVRTSLQLVGEEVITGMQTRLVQMGIMAQIGRPHVLSADEWRKFHPNEVPIGIVPLYSSCGICHLAFNLTNL